MNRFLGFYDSFPVVTTKTVKPQEIKNHFVMKIEDNQALFLTRFNKTNGEPVWSRNMSSRRMYSQDIAKIAATNSNGVVVEL